MPSLRHANDWEELASVDPCWAILPAQGTRKGRWELDRFFQTGQADVAALMARAEELGRPIERTRVLDVGCGVGRHARWFAAEFEQYVGVDVSATMAERARQFHGDLLGVQFAVDDATTLHGLEADSFDLVQCWLVLIHLPDRDAIVSAIAALIRTLRPGGMVVFQVATHIAVRNRLEGRRRLYRGLRRFGMTPRSLYQRLGLNPVRMTAIRPDDVQEHLMTLGARVLASQDGSLGEGIRSRVYYATK